MKEKLFRGIYNSSLIKKFLASPSPSWLVWFADTVIVLLSCLLTVVFGSGKTSYPSIWFAIPMKVTVCVAVYAAINTLFATYRYVVRLSSLIDVARTIKLILGASIVFSDYIHRDMDSDRRIIHFILEYLRNRRNIVLDDDPDASFHQEHVFIPDATGQSAQARRCAWHTYRLPYACRGIKK